MDRKQLRKLEGREEGKNQRVKSWEEDRRMIKQKKRKRWRREMSWQEKTEEENKGKTSLQAEDHMKWTKSEGKRELPRRIKHQTKKRANHLFVSSCLPFGRSPVKPPDGSKHLAVWSEISCSCRNTAGFVSSNSEANRTCCCLPISDF